MRDRRKSERLVATFPVVVESQSRYIFRTLSRNVGTSGLLVMMAVKLEVDEPVLITYAAPGQEGSEPLDIEGRIVRVEQNEGEDRATWPFLAAVELTGEAQALARLVGERPDEPPANPGSEGGSERR